MALTETGPVEKVSDTQNHNRHPEKKEKPFTKVIIRRLPPSMDQESFLNQVSPVPDYDYIYIVKGDFSLGENAFSRVYINFTNPEDIYTFKEKFDNYIFLDNKGNEYPAVVEFASFQKIPKKRSKVKSDPKCGSIETDPLYLEFLESLKEQPNSEEKPEFSYQITSENKLDTTTPLLEFVKQRRIERQRIKDERREERKRKEMERRTRVKEEDRKKRFEEKSPIKALALKPNVNNKQGNLKEKTSEEEVKTKDSSEKSESSEKPEGKPAEKGGYSSYHKSKEHKYEDKKGFSSRSKYPPKPEKKEHYDKSEYKSRKSYEDHKKEDTKYNKKVKKYSERREERKNEAKKVEQKKLNKDTEKEGPEKDADNTSVEVEADGAKKVEPKKVDSKKVDHECENDKEYGGEKSGSKENDPRAQRRIRNKDRPTMAIYQPGMLSKKRHNDGECDAKETKTTNKDNE